MAENKTQKTKASVAAFLAGITDEAQRKDAKALAALIRKVTGKAPAMWGDAIVGYGDMTYEGSGGRTVDWFPVGFSPRKAALTLYLMGGLRAHAALLAKLGKHKVGGGCLYVPALAGVDLDVLAELVKRSYASNAAVAVRKAAPRAKATPKRSNPAKRVKAPAKAR